MSDINGALGESSIPRGQFLRYLRVLGVDEVSYLVAGLGEGLKIENLRQPRVGLALMTLRDAAFADAFHPGEIPWCRVHVKVTDSEGRSGEGAVDCMDDRLEYVRNLAVLDAVLACRLTACETVQAAVSKGRAKWLQMQSERASLLEQTRVVFSRLDVSSQTSGARQDE